MSSCRGGITVFHTRGVPFMISHDALHHCVDADELLKLDWTALERQTDRRDDGASGGHVGGAFAKQIEHGGTASHVRRKIGPQRPDRTHAFVYDLPWEIDLAVVGGGLQISRTHQNIFLVQLHRDERTQLDRAVELEVEKTQADVRADCGRRELCHNHLIGG